MSKIKTPEEFFRGRFHDCEDDVIETIRAYHEYASKLEIEEIAYNWGCVKYALNNKYPLDKIHIFYEVKELDKVIKKLKK